MHADYNHIVSKTITTGRVDALGSIAIGDYKAGNYTSIEADGTIAFYGDATVWDDMRVPMTSSKAGGAKDPGFAAVLTDGAGSQGVYAWHFDKSIEEELFFAVQLPHAWKGTAIDAHCHWLPTATGAGAVCWALEYTWAGIGDVFGNTTIIYGNTTSAGDATKTALKHYLTSIGEIAPTATGVSSMLLCRVYRDATGGLATDDYNADAVLLEVDFHIEIDTLGSREEYTK